VGVAAISILVGGIKKGDRGFLTASSGVGINFIQAVMQPMRGKFSSMESLITHFRLTSEG
jgi:hypothetical protein